MPFSIRIKVDLPEPDRPMTTKISPSSDLERDVATAAVTPSRRSSAGSTPWPILRRGLGGSPSKIFETPCTRSLDTSSFRSGRAAGLGHRRSEPGRAAKCHEPRPAQQPLTRLYGLTAVTHITYGCVNRLLRPNVWRH